MTASASFMEYLKDCLSVVGPVTVKRMFGGAGVYAEGVMFGLVANDVLYFKADKQNESDYIAEELEPFTYDGKKKPIKMSYWQVPERVFDDPDEMTVWAEAALGAARRAAKKKKPAKAKKKKVTAKKKTSTTKKPKKSKRNASSKRKS